MVNEAIKFIEKAKDAEKPFFTLVWFGSPHEPHSGLPKDLALYDDLPEKYNEQTVRLTSNETGKRIERPLRGVLRERYAEITAMDRAIGTLRTYLEDEGLKENTIFWYCSDNGIPPTGMFEPRMLRDIKGSIYDGGTRVPSVLEWPARIPAPTVSDVCAVTTDTLPTICALLDLPLPNRALDGISIEGMFDGTMLTRPEPIYFWNFGGKRRRGENRPEPWIDPELQKGTTPLVKEMAGKLTRDFRNARFTEIYPEDYLGSKAVIDGRYKLIVNEKRDMLELYDLEDDPMETRDLAKFKPEIVQKLKLGMGQWQSSVLRSLLGLDYDSQEK
jgi:arylsulfatase A-like enzyme